LAGTPVSNKSYEKYYKDLIWEDTIKMVKLLK
jgi:alpha-galactosidase